MSRSSSSTHGLRAISSKERRKLIEKILSRDGVCVYCGCEGPLTLDHVVPVSRGGSNGNSNLAACCVPCNEKKKDMLLSEAGMKVCFGGLRLKGQ